MIIIEKYSWLHRRNTSLSDFKRIECRNNYLNIQ